jgi:hypothetical protein
MPVDHAAHYVAFCVTEGCLAFDNGIDLVGGPFPTRAEAEWWIPYYRVLLGAWVYNVADAGGQATVGALTLHPSDLLPENAARKKAGDHPLPWPPQVVDAKEGDKRAFAGLGIHPPRYLSEKHVRAAVEECYRRSAAGEATGKAGRRAILCVLSFAASVGRGEVVCVRRGAAPGHFLVKEENAAWTGRDGRPLEFSCYLDAAQEQGRRWGNGKTSLRAGRIGRDSAAWGGEKTKAPLPV